MLFKIIKPVPIAAFFFLSCAWTMKAQIMGIKRFAAPDEYRNAKITCLYKGHNGYIYTGTTNGLYRLDGIRYTPIEFSTSHFNDTVTALFEDLNGRLWTGYNSGRIAYLLNDHLVYFNPEEGLPKKRITGLLSDAQNNLWFSSSGEGIYYMQDSHMHLLDETDDLVSPPRLNFPVLSAGFPALAARARPGALNLGVARIDGQDMWTADPNTAFPLQSVFKAPLAAAAFAQIDAGRLMLNQTVRLTQADLSVSHAMT